MGQQEGGTSRRAVLRAAATSVWAAPVIAVATAAPAAAVGSPVGTIELTNAAGTAGTQPVENTNLLGLITSLTGAVRNTGTVALVSPITVTIQFPLLAAGAIWNVSGTGWSGGGTINVSGQLVLTYTGTLAAGQATPSFTLTPVVSVSLGTITGTANATDIYGHALSNSDTFA